MNLIYIKNTIEILNNILESDTFPLMSGYYTVIKNLYSYCQRATNYGENKRWQTIPCSVQHMEEAG